MLRKVFRLGLAGFVTAMLCVTYIYFFRNQKLYQTYRCWKAAPHWYSCYSQSKDFDFSTDFYGMRFEGNVKNEIDRLILYYGAYEKPVLYFLRDVMRLVYANQGVFLDVGANVGQHSIFMSRYAQEVHAIEPYEPVLQRFRRMIKINNIKNIVIHPVGFGNENRKSLFHEPPAFNLGEGSFLKEFSSENAAYKELQLVIGDELLETINVASSVNLIKMDIEGYERYALPGLARTLATKRPVVVFELIFMRGSSYSFKNESDMRSVFPQGYEFLAFDQSCDPYTGYYHLAKFSQEVHFDKPVRYNIVAYPSEKKNQIPVKAPSVSPQF